MSNSQYANILTSYDHVLHVLFCLLLLDIDFLEDEPFCEKSCLPLFAVDCLQCQHRYVAHSLSVLMSCMFDKDLPSEVRPASSLA